MLVGQGWGEKPEGAAFEANPQVEGAGAEFGFVGFHVDDAARRVGPGRVEGVVHLSVGEGDVAAVAQHVAAEVYLSVLAVGDGNTVDGKGAELAAEASGRDGFDAAQTAVVFKGDANHAPEDVAELGIAELLHLFGRGNLCGSLCLDGFRTGVGLDDAYGGQGDGAPGGVLCGKGLGDGAQKGQ